MMRMLGDYVASLIARFGTGWNRFWFAPSDPYPLGVLRIGAGLMALYLHVTLGFDLIRFFGANGLTPLGSVGQLEAGGGAFSIYNYVSRSQDLWIVYSLSLAAVVLFTLGFLTRVTSILALIATVSVVNRAPMLATQAEAVLAMLMFYLCIGPCGACLSLDALLARRRRANAIAPESKLLVGNGLSMFATIAIRLMQVHLAMFYGVMGLSKLMGNVWWNGDAMWWLIARPEARLVDFTGISQYGANFLTHAVVFFELTFAVLIWNRLARPLLLLLAAVLWTFLALVTGQIPFCLTMLIANLAFAPLEFFHACCGSCCGPGRKPTTLA